MKQETIDREKQYAESVQRRKRFKLANSLTLKPQRICRTLHYCELCGKDIKDGETYYDGGYGHRAHLACTTLTLIKKGGPV